MFPIIFQSLLAYKISDLPGLICIWNNVHEISTKHFWKEHLCAAKVSYVCASLGSCVRAHAHSLEGTLAKTYLTFTLFVSLSLCLSLFLSLYSSLQEFQP